MDIKSIGSLVTKMPEVGMNKDSKSGTVFNDLYKSAINMLDETNTLQKNADQMSVDFALGRTDNIADVMVAQEKASTSLQYTVTLGNKLIEAYNEIIRIQV